MNFKDCLSKRMIREEPTASERVGKSLDISQRFISSSKKNLEIQELEMAEIASYNAIFHAARALLFKKGFIERSHICVIIALKELYETDHGLIDLLHTFDKIRISRHNIQCGGSLVDREESEFVYHFAEQFLEKAKIILK